MSTAILEMLATAGWREMEERLTAKIVTCYLRYPTATTWEEKVALDIEIAKLRELLTLPEQYGQREVGEAQKRVNEKLIEELM